MKHLAIAFVLFVAACGGKSSGTTTTDPCKDPCKDKVDGDPPAAEIVTLNSLEQGDTSCGVQFTRGDGSEGFLDGDFELCPGGANDATGLIGQPVRFTIEMGNVMAASCEGDPECPDTETVEIVMTIMPVE